MILWTLGNLLLFTSGLTGGGPMQSDNHVKYLLILWLHSVLTSPFPSWPYEITPSKIHFLHLRYCALLSHRRSRRWYCKHSLQPGGPWQISNHIWIHWDRAGLWDITFHQRNWKGKREMKCRTQASVQMSLNIWLLTHSVLILFNKFS